MLFAGVAILAMVHAKFVVLAVFAMVHAMFRKGPQSSNGGRRIPALCQSVGFVIVCCSSLLCHDNCEVRGEAAPPQGPESAWCGGLALASLCRSGFVSKCLPVSICHGMCFKSLDQLRSQLISGVAVIAMVFDVVPIVVMLLIMFGKGPQLPNGRGTGSLVWTCRAPIHLNILSLSLSPSVGPVLVAFICPSSSTRCTSP